MAGRIRFLLKRDGRYYARKVVPQAVRGTLKTSELRVPLGADYKKAVLALPLALVQIDTKINGA